MGTDFLYMQIKKYLLALIAKNQSNPLYRLPSETQLSMKFHCDRICAKRALNDLKEEGLIIRVQGRGSFIAQSTTGTTCYKKSICLMLPSIDRRYALDILNGVEDFCVSVDDLNLYFTLSKSKADIEAQMLDSAIEKQFDGLIVFPSHYDNFSRRLLNTVIKDYAIIFVGQTVPGINISSISSDHHEQSQKALAYLYQVGHRHIGFIVEQESSSWNHSERIRGYKDFIEQYAPQNSHLCEIDFFTGHGQEEYTERIRSQITHFLKQHSEITAILASTLAGDILLEYLESLDSNTRHPDLMFFDEPENWSWSAEQNLLYVDQHPYKMGYCAAELLYKQITEKTPPQQIMIEPSIVSRSR